MLKTLLPLIVLVSSTFAAKTDLSGCTLTIVPLLTEIVTTTGVAGVQTYGNYAETTFLVFTCSLIVTASGLLINGVYLCSGMALSSVNYWIAAAAVHPPRLTFPVVLDIPAPAQFRRYHSPQLHSRSSKLESLERPLRLLLQSRPGPLPQLSLRIPSPPRLLRLPRLLQHPLGARLLHLQQPEAGHKFLSLIPLRPRAAL